MTLTRDELVSASFPHPVHDIAVRETHISLVVLTGEFAYKIKKAVQFDFIDASSLERRRALCEEELRLNRRYAAEIYLRVVPIARDASGLRFDGAGDAVEYAVCMRQFDRKDELPALLQANAVETADFADLAERLGAFHAEAARAQSASDCACTASFLRIARANSRSVAKRAARVDARPIAEQLDRWTGVELDRRLVRLRERERQGSIRECHGDLHARNIVRWHGRLTPFDCIEFDPDLRFIDVLNDLAFLVMDLIDRERTDLAFTLLNRYFECTGDYEGLDLAPCYLVYRALVRAKVDLIAAEQHPESGEMRERALSRLRTASRLAQPHRPVLVVTHGASGSGKSWLSERLAPQAPAVRIRSDLERKRLAGVDPMTPQASQLDTGIYTREFNERTYAHLLDCARACLEGGFNTIVDAAFLDIAERRRFAELAADMGSGFLILACHADPETLATRIEQRQHAQIDPSDADIAVLKRQLQSLQEFCEDEAPYVLRVDTRDPDVVRKSLNELLGPSTVTRRSE